MPTMAFTYNMYINTDCARTEKAIIYFLLLNTERVVRFTLVYHIFLVVEYRTSRSLYVGHQENLTQYIFI